MTETAPKLMPCPNPECPSNNGSQQIMDVGAYTKKPISYFVRCHLCGYRGPDVGLTEDEAIRLHNLLCRPNPETQAVAIWPAWHKLSEQKPMLDGIHDAVSSRKLCVVVQVDGRDEMCSLQVRSWNTAQGGSDRFDMGYAGYDEHHDAHVTDWCDLPTMPWYPPVQYHSPVESVPADARALNLKWGRHDGRGIYHIEWHAPCGCAYHPEPKPHVHPCIKHSEIDPCPDL